MILCEFIQTRIITREPLFLPLLRQQKPKLSPSCSFFFAFQPSPTTLLALSNLSNGLNSFWKTLQPTYRSRRMVQMQGVPPDNGHHPIRKRVRQSSPRAELTTPDDRGTQKSAILQQTDAPEE